VNWYCIHTRPKKEEQVAAYCRDTLALETYYPRLRQQKTIRRQRRQVVSPLFPRYLFCRFEPSASYRSVRYAPDAIDLVHVGTKPAVVTDRLIAELKHWAGDAIDIVTIHPPLRPGDPVEITEGPLTGFATILHTSDDRDRVAILLSLLQCGAQMVISRSQIRRLA
jgi:transcriptional antiterminator RfaH